MSSRIEPTNSPAPPAAIKAQLLFVKAKTKPPTARTAPIVATRIPIESIQPPFLIFKYLSIWLSRLGGLYHFYRPWRLFFHYSFHQSSDFTLNAVREFSEKSHLPRIGIYMKISD